MVPAEIDDCPPADADPASGIIFRCGKRRPPHEGDMKTHEEKDLLPDADPCLRRALSVFRSQQDAEHQIRLFRKWRKKYILRANLSPAHGLIKLTDGKQPTHSSWWPGPELDPSARAALFEVVREVTEGSGP